jgi:hypothetical protein
MTASLPAARTVDLNVDGSMTFPPTTGLSRRGEGLFLFQEALMKMELAMYQALRAIDVPELKAEAVIQALESDMLTLLATKSDLTNLELRLTAEITHIDHRLTSEIHRLTAEIAKSDLKLSIRMASMLAVTIGILIGAMKVFL